MKEVSEKQKKLIGSLRETDKKVRVKWNSNLGVFRQIEGKLLQGKPAEKPEAIVNRFLKTYWELVAPKLPARTTQLKVIRKGVTKAGDSQLNIQLRLNDIVVLDGQIIAFVNKKRILSKVVSSLPRDIKPVSKPKVTSKQLVNILRELFYSHPDAEEYQKRIKKWRYSLPLTSKPNLAVCRTAHGFRPVWTGFAVIPCEIAVPAGNAEEILTQAEYIVDAIDGGLVKAESSLEFAEVSVGVHGNAVLMPEGTLVDVTTRGVQKDGADYFLKNIDNGIEIITYDSNGADYTTLEFGTKIQDDTLVVSRDADGNWSDAADTCTVADRRDSQQPEIDAHRFAGQIYGFYEAMGWEGFDNNGWDGCPVRLITHIGMSPTGTGAAFEKYENNTTHNMHGYIKFYDGMCDGGTITYDFFAGELGTIAHEYQHAVTYFGAPKPDGSPGRLYALAAPYQYFGMLREGFSDSFAGFTSGIWMLRAPWPAGIGVTGLPLRRIEFPRSVDTVNGTPNCDHYDDISTSADKYYKSGILSHAAFLIGQGGIHERAARAAQYIPVPSIGREAAARIWIEALTTLFPGISMDNNDERMVDAGNFLLDAAETLHGVRSREYVLLRRALYAVGVYPYDDTTTPYTKQSYGGEACMIPWGYAWQRSQEYLSLPMFRYWQSMDLFIDNGGGPEYDATVGAENNVYARVRNIGDQDLSNVSVEFWYRKAGSALPAAETEWKRCKDMAGNDITLEIPLLSAGTNFFDDVYTDAEAVKWYLDPAEIVEGIDHFCLRAKIICAAPNHDNDYENIVQSNVHHVMPDPDGDTDFTIAFMASNWNKRKQLPVDIRLDHSLPPGAKIVPKHGEEKIVLKPGEERPLYFKLHVPASKTLEPPFDGEIKGEIYGDLCGPIKGNISRVMLTGKNRITGTISCTLGCIGSITGRLEGTVSIKSRTISGKACVAFSSAKKARKHEGYVIGVKAELTPLRVVNFTQMDGDVAVGGITTRLVYKKK